MQTGQMFKGSLHMLKQIKIKNIQYELTKSSSQEPCPELDPSLLNGEPTIAFLCSSKAISSPCDRF